MNDIDRILSIIENPTRRKILQAVVREPHYPLQLSKELGVSQQAIMKNLNVMEKNGILISYRESSDRGPDRIFYKPSSEFTLIIDLRTGMFETDIIPAQNKPDEYEISEETTQGRMELENVRQNISYIDRQISEFDRMRSELIGQRNAIMTAFIHDMDNSRIDYVHRCLLYKMLDSPDGDADTISRDLGVNEDSVTEMMREVIGFCKMNEKEE
jgi:ArsR family transcriptional regulator